MECSAGSEEWQRNTILTKNTLDMTQPCFCCSRRQAPTELDQPHLQQKRNAQTCRDKMSVKWTLVVGIQSRKSKDLDPVSKKLYSAASCFFSIQGRVAACSALF